MFGAAEVRPGASLADITRCERELGAPLPADYKALLQRSDGLEGFVDPDAYLVLWSTAELAASNRGYQVAEFLPGVTLIGTDGGGEGYGFTYEHGQLAYVEVPLIGMERSEMVIVGASFMEFLARLPELNRGREGD